MARPYPIPRRFRLFLSRWAPWRLTPRFFPTATLDTAETVSAARLDTAFEEYCISDLILNKRNVHLSIVCGQQVAVKGLV
jgi:hypothetical protein